MRVLMTYAAPTSGGGKGAAALRQTPRLLAAHDEASAWLVAALIDARILVSGYDQNKVPIIALAHQRVIEAWKRARTIVAESENLLRIRDEVEEARRRWEESGQRRDRLIPVGLPLSEAENAAATLQDELPVETRAYIEKSGRAARLRQRMTAAAAVVFLAVAAAAVFFGKEAGEAAREARQQTQLAEQAANESQKQTHLTEQRSAMLTADVARSLTTEGSLDQALLLMLDSGRLFDDKSVPDEIRIAFTKTLEKKSRIETKTLFPNMQVFETDAALLLVNRETNEIFKLTDSVSPSRLVEGSTGDSPILSLRQSVKGDEVIVLRKNLEVERIDMKRGSRRKVGVFSEPKEYPGRVYNKPDWTEPEITANDLVVRGSKNSSQIMDSETGRIFEREMTGTTGAHINKSVDTRLHHVACIGDMNSAVKASVFKELRESTAFPGVSISCKKFASTRTLMDTGGDRYLFTVFTSGSSGLWRSDKLFDDDGTMTNIQQMFSKNNLTDSDFAWVGVQERFGGSTIGVLFNRDAVVREAPDGDVKVNYRHPTIVTHARFSGRDRFIVVESEIGRVVAHDFGSTPRRSDTLFSTPTQSIIGTEKPSKTLHHGDCVGFSSLFPRAHSDILPDDRKIFYPAPGKHEIRVVNDKDTVVINLDEAYCIQFSADWKRMLGLQPSGVRIYDFDRVIASRSLAEGEIGMIPLSEPPTSGFFVGQSGDAIVTADDSNRVLLWKRDANNAKWVKTEVFHGEHSVLYAEPDADGERLLLIENVAVGSSEIHGFLYSIRARQEWFDLGNDYKFFGAAFTDNSEVVVSKHWTWTNVFPVLPLSALVALANKELSPECRPPHEGNFKSSPCWPSSYQ
jgi:hypothetical protein